MATTQLVRSQTKQGNWSGIFPQEQVTETQSTLFVKKLLAVAVSSISYLRAIFPEHAFGDRCLEDINLKILRDDSACPGACQVIQWVKGCFEAIDKKYLKVILVGIYENPDDPDTVIEQYIFKFSYLNGQSIDIYRNKSKIASAQSADETKKATIRLLRTIILLSQTLSPLPDDVMMTMKLLYDDEVTPPDYQPPGFTECSRETFDFSEEAMKLRIGDVSTQYHEVKLRIATTCHQLKCKEDDNELQPMEENVDDKENEAPQEQAPPQENNAIMPEEKSGTDQVAPQQDTAAQEVQQEIEEQISTSPPQEPVKASCNTRNSTPGSAIAACDDGDNVTVCCPCDVNEDDGLMILCARCNTWQHALCFGILEAEEAPETHVCVDCSKSEASDEFVPTDSYLITLKAEELKELCLWRRTLSAVCETARVLAPSLAKRLGVETHYASHLVKRLESEGYLKSNNKSKRLGKMVLKSKIQNEGFTKYFRQGLAENDEAIDLSTHNIDTIVSKASDLRLDEAAPNPVGKPVVPSQRCKGRKRAVSTINGDNEFEISDSQDVPEMGENNKKRKTSIASKSILV